jgi:hypothetical protein
VVERSWLDQSASRMMGVILSEKLSTLTQAAHAEGSPPSQEIDALQQEVASICDRQHLAHLQWVDAAESTGYLALRQIRVVAWYLETPEGTEPSSEDALDRFVEAILKETRGSLLSLRSATRSDLGGWLLLEDGSKAAIEEHEAGCRRSLEALQPKIRERIGGSWPPLRWWIRLGQANRVAVVLGIAALAVGVVTLLSGAG